MNLVRNAFTGCLHLGSMDFDLEGLAEINAIELNEELQRMICSVSGRPDHNGL